MHDLDHMIHDSCKPHDPYVTRTGFTRYMHMIYTLHVILGTFYVPGGVSVM